MVKIIIASKNSGKIIEIKKILSLRNVELLDFHGLEYPDEIDESGSTFEENAFIKAKAVYGKYHLPVIADDSGLCVSALGGEPGIHSARFAGSEARDEDNIRLLLQRLQDVPNSGRKAYFMCSAVFYYDSGQYYLAEGKVSGFITRSPTGIHGFGYDPVFYLPQYGKTIAQLEDREKNRISHRFIAFRKLKKYIEEYVNYHN